MESRRDIMQRAYALRGAALLITDKAQAVERERLRRSADALIGDLARLRETPESTDMIEELHLRFLARCRLVRLGEYCIVGFVGAGRCGAVYRAIPIGAAGPPVALKVLMSPRNEEEMDRFRIEGAVLRRLDHPAIVRGLTETQGVEFLPVLWYAMELVENALTLESYFARSPLKDKLGVLAQVCSALQYAHDEEVVHRDLHTENVLVDRSGQPRILDFGSAKHGATAATFKPIGALKTSAPEKLDNPASVTGKSDVFSVGCMLYYACTGNWPFWERTYGDCVRRIAACDYRMPDDLDPRLEECLAASLVLSEHDRQTAGGLSELIGDAIEHL